MQPYLATLYTAFFTTMYFGMFRIGELVASQHVIKVKDVQLAGNKNKIMFILRTSKTHGLEAKPQHVKITSSAQVENGPWYHREYTANLCSFHMLRCYLAVRPKYDSVTEQFFVFRDRSLLKPDVVRAILKDRLKVLGLDPTVYNTHSWHAGHCIDLHKLGVNFGAIKIFGWWKSNVICTYLKG